MTNATISTIKATKVLPSVQLSDEDGTTLITNFSPISPLLIVFVESSTHKRVRVGDILACCSELQEPTSSTTCTTQYD
jgi:hypothetical protein